MTGYASCCVLAYERPRQLRRALATLIAHADAPFELLVHDDGSTDPAVRKLLVDAVTEGWVSSVILNPPGLNQGQGVALNRMFHMASGDVIVKVDADLEFKPGWLRQVNEIFALNELMVQDGDDPIGLLGLLHYWHFPVSSADTLIADHGLYSERTHILGSAFAMPRKAWEAFGPFDEHSEAFAEDWAMQQKVTGSYMCCALPADDLCTNDEMGLGKSTVVKPDGSVREIHKSPKVFGL